MELLGVYLVAQHDETLNEKLPGYRDQRLLRIASFHHSMKKGLQALVSLDCYLCCFAKQESQCSRACLADRPNLPALA